VRPKGDEFFKDGGPKGALNGDLTIALHGPAGGLSFTEVFELFSCKNLLEIP